MRFFRQMLPFATPLALVTMVACSADRLPTAVERPDANSVAARTDSYDTRSTARGGRLTTCAVGLTYSASQVVGEMGGTINIGPHRIDIPRGALSRAVTISAVAPAGDRMLVDFQPHGLEFSKPVELKLNYVGCATNPASLQVVYLNDAARMLEYLPTQVHATGGKVSAQLRHFSKYALAE